MKNQEPQEPFYSHRAISQCIHILIEYIYKSKNPYLDLWQNNNVLANPINRDIIAIHYLDYCHGILRSRAEVGLLVSPKRSREAITDHFYDITQAFKSDPSSQNIPQSLFKQKNFGEFVLTYLMGGNIYIYDREKDTLFRVDDFT
jgi:hypothetical protein